MSEIQLLEATFAGGIRNANFVNGQLLNAEDLRAAQSANWQEHDELGIAAGTGIVCGFTVAVANTSTPARPVVRVTSGLALNGKGELILLGGDVDVVLTTTATAAATNGGVFAQCQPPQLETALTNLGVYILTAMPASGYQEMRPVAELGSNGVGTSCGSRYITEGVKFRLVQLDLTAAPNATPARTAASQLVSGTDANLSLLARSTGSQASALQRQIAADLNKLRNIVAHLCFGTDTTATFPADPFTRNLDATSPFTRYGVLDELKAQGILQPCEVPLAALFWTATGLQFVDMWGVRRRLIQRGASAQWPLPLSSRHATESDAAFLQFQEQLEFLFGASTQQTLAGASATAFFRYLPACGFVPVTGNGSAKGFDPLAFFQTLSPGVITTISGAKLGQLLADSQLHRPVDLTQRNMLQLYQVRENLNAVQSGQSGQLYIIFASREMQNILETDAVQGAFQDAWQAYRGLVKRRAFLPTETGTDAIGARIDMVAAVQDVMSVALQKSAIAAAGNLNYDDALAAFTDLYGIQRDLALFFLGLIPGAPEGAARQSFAATLLAFLDKIIPPNIASLRVALQAGDLPKVIIAQGAINNLLGTSTGEGAALGFIDVLHKSSPRGTNLVPGDVQPYPHIFTIGNRTDRTLTIQLAASMSAPHGTWTGAVQFHDASGKPITTITLASQATQDVSADITVPSDAQVSETAVLNVAISVGPPHNKSNQANLNLPITGTSGPPVTQTVTINSFAIPPGDLNNVAVGGVLAYVFNIRYGAAAGPATATFKLHVDLTQTPTAASLDWAAFALSASSGGTAVLDVGGIKLAANATQDTQITLQIRAPLARASVDKTLSFVATFSSTDLPSVVSQASQTFTLRLAHS